MRASHSIARKTMSLAALVCLPPICTMAAPVSPSRFHAPSHVDEHLRRHTTARRTSASRRAHDVARRPERVRSHAPADPPRRSRDPFAPLISDTPSKGKRAEPIRPPGEAGLVIGEIHVQGTVQGPHGAAAVVSDPAGRVYFLRAGDKVFNGTVERIDLNGVEFIEHSRDAFGREFDRRVTRPVQSTLGAKP